MVEDGIVVSRPRGTVTFLLTDVEGSTQRWDTAPDAMEQAIPRHYELIADAISARNGYRPVEQGEGDSVVGAFSQRVRRTHGRARGTARTRHRALAVGSGHPGADGDPHGGGGAAAPRDIWATPSIEAERIRATGHGGQVLLSSATASLASDNLPLSSDARRPRTPPVEGSRSPRAHQAAAASRPRALLSCAALDRSVPSQPARAAHSAHRSSGRGARGRRSHWPRTPQ